MPIIEVGCMGVKPNLDIMDDNTREGQILTGAWKAVTTAAGGPHQVYWGLEIEDLSRVWAFFDWDSIEDHDKFAKSFGGEAVKDFPLILTHGEFTKHIDVTISAAPALKSPVTEVMLFYFSSDLSQARRDAAIAKLKTFLDETTGSCSDIKGVSYGWGVENDFPIRGEEGQQGSILAAFIGWPSIDAHAKFRETETFQESSNLIETIEGVIKSVVFHINCQSLERGQN
ncbi:hypothetical protein F5884DRAFT_897092 [Xylogone sp. PMI_703]|nr:hypothetical protein F5884DRAFT_897092 [Xylogone sp. PMI_703]